MERNPVSMVKRQLEACPTAVKQVLLLLAVLRELLCVLLGLLRGNISLEDVHERFKALQPGYPEPSDDVRCTSSLSRSESQDSESTWNVSERPQSLVNAVRTLCRTIVQRDVKMVCRMLEAAPRLVGKRHEGGWFPLHAAVLSGDVELVKLVLDCPKADVNAVYKANSTTTTAVRESELGTHVDDTSGATPLHYACMIGNIEIIRLLVARGALFRTLDGKQREPIEYFDLQNLDAVDVFGELYRQWKEHDEFFREYSRVDDLADLIRGDNYDIFERSIKQHPEIASKLTAYDFSLLHLAVIRQRRRFVELLISTDQSLVNMVDRRSGWTSLTSHSAFAPGHIPHRHVKDATPLHYACLMQDMDIAGMLLEAGADWNIKDQKGRIPEQLIHAVGTTCDELKSAFACLRDAEDERRRQAESDKYKDMAMDAEPYDSYSSPDQDEWQDDGSEHDHSNDMDTDHDNTPDHDDNTISKVTVQSLLSLEKALEDRLVGQRGPIRSVATAIRRRESGWVDSDRPLTMLFLGSSGVGKTELAKQVALYIHGKNGLSTRKGDSISQLEKNHGFVRIDMSEFQESHTVLNLIGAPKSYVGYGEGAALTTPLKKNPNAVVLLDEIEKAHPDVLNTFLQVFDDGRITDSQAGVISCKNAIFIMTSNIAADRIKEEAPRLRELIAKSEKEGRPESYLHLIQDFTRSIRPELKYHLRRDEFVGRINEIIVFLPLNQEEIELAVHRELAIWCKRAEEQHKISLTWTEDVVRKLALSYDVNYGVRSVANEVQRIAMQLVADAHIRGQLPKDWKASLSTNEVGDIVMKARAKAGVDKLLQDTINLRT